MSTPSFRRSRRPLLRGSAATLVGRSAAVAATAIFAGIGVPAIAYAGPGEVKLTSVYAAPINPAPTGTTADDNVACTPEPDNNTLYGTQATFNPLAPIDPSGRGAGWPANASYGYAQSAGTNPPTEDPAYTPANVGSTADLTKDLQAGKNSDLCFGFTLTPNVQRPVADASNNANLQNPQWVRGPASAGLNPSGHRLQSDPPVPDVDATHVAVNPDDGQPINNDDLKSATIQMPEGFLGDPDSTATCSEADFALTNYLKSACVSGGAANTQVGTAFVRVSTIVTSRTSSVDPTLKFFPQTVEVGGLPNKFGTITTGAAVYNLVHSPNELARLGVSVQPVSGLGAEKFVVRLVFASDGSGRVEGVVDNAPRNLYSTGYIYPANASWQPGDPNEPGTLKPGAVASPLYLESVGIRAWGSKAAHPALNADFAQWGTDCSTDLSAHASIDTYLGSKSVMSSPSFKLTGCDQLPFNPSVTVKTAETSPGVPTATSVSVDIPQVKTDTGLLPGLLKDATVTLPAGLEIGAQAGARDGGLLLCSADQFNKASSAANTCPAGSIAGDVTIVTPLLKTPFTGHVYLGAQSAVGELPALYLEATPQGATAADAPRVKLIGSVSADANGQITTKFLNAPQLRFSELKIDFPGGPNALFSTPRTCGETTGTSTFVSSTTATKTATSSININTDCDLPKLAPSFSMVPTDSTVGSHAPTTITIARNDRSPWLTGIAVSLPSGFLADLTAASECPLAQAATGDCADSSRIATVTSVAGVGTNPYSLTGQMFLTERNPGSVAGATIVVRAKIGDLDLGNVVVPAKIDLRPTDAGLTLTTTAPTRFKGLALNLRSIAVSLDRPNFPLNPTACGPLQAVGSFTGDDGVSVSATSSVSYTGCAARPLKPTITATTTGPLTFKAHPQLNISVTTRPGDSNLKSTSVLLPAGFAADLPNVQVKCDSASFLAGACPASTRVGSVKAKVAITSDILSGDLFMIAVPGQVLPGIGMSFTGRYTQRVASMVKIDGPTKRLLAVFDAIPDLPLTRLDLTIDGGAKSPIQIGAQCTEDSSFDATFGGQGGQTATQKVPFPCATVTPPKPTLKWSKKTGLKLTVSSPTGKTIKSAKFTLPSGFSIKSAKSKAAKKAQAKNVKFSLTGGKGKTKISSKSLSIVASGAGPTTATVTIKPKAYSVSKKLSKSFKKGKSVKVKIRVVSSTGTVLASTITVKIT